MITVGLISSLFVSPVFISFPIACREERRRTKQLKMFGLSTQLTTNGQLATIKSADVLSPSSELLVDTRNTWDGCPEVKKSMVSREFLVITKPCGPISKWYSVWMKILKQGKFWFCKEHQWTKMLKGLLEEGCRSGFGPTN